MAELLKTYTTRRPGFFHETQQMSRFRENAPASRLIPRTTSGQQRLIVATADETLVRA